MLFRVENTAVRLQEYTIDLNYYSKRITSTVSTIST